MEIQILEKYLGGSNLEKDPRRQELLKDSIDLIQWEFNIQFAARGLKRDMLLPKEDDQEVIDAVTPVFAKIVEDMAWGTDCPPALNLNDMFWYIAAYPDVVNFFYPAINYSGYGNDEQRKKIDEARQVKHQLIRRFEGQAFPDQAQNAEPSVFEYFAALKDFYKAKQKLLLSK